MNIAFGYDHAGIDIKEKIIKHLEKQGNKIIDLGCDNKKGCDYPDIAINVSRLVSGGKCERGILICGTGVGMSMVANKFPGVRAGVCWNADVAKLISEHNNANIICLPARFSQVEGMLECIDAWLSTEFSKEERHVRRVGKIKDLDKKFIT